MTPGQRKMLEILSNQSKPYTPLENNFGSLAMVCDRLVEQGLASAYMHGGYEITDAGRATLEGKK